MMLPLYGVFVLVIFLSHFQSEIIQLPEELLWDDGLTSPGVSYSRCPGPVQGESNIET